MTQEENDYVKNMDKVVEMRRHIDARDGVQAMEIYAQLPDSLKKDKTILLFRVMATASLWS